MLSLIRNVVTSSVLTLMLSLVSSLALADNPQNLYHVGNRYTGWDQGLSKGAFPEDEKGLSFLNKVQPILTTRCIACHGCYEAPCQLNLQSYEGVRRGYNPIPLFSSGRLDYSTPPTRMEDASSIEGWRKLGFLPVASNAGEPDQADKADRFRDSLMYRFVTQSFEHNKSGFPLADPEELQTSYLNDFAKTGDNNLSKRGCVATPSQFQEHYSQKNEYKVVSFEDFIGQSNFLGMPLGLPRISETQYGDLAGWLEAGAEGPSAPVEALLEKPTKAASIVKWETFLNQTSNQAQQTSRYVYEHVFSTIIHFDENPGEYFDLVRSTTPTGAIVQMVTELPTQKTPGVNRFYYRFKKVTRAIVQKTTNVWHLSDTKLKHLEDQFMSDWGPAPIPAPDYDAKNTNIFNYFERIPAAIRARFMIENSRIIVGAMVQGSVCIGTTATYAIADHFWAWFLKPEMDPSVQNPTLGLPSLSILNTNPEPWKPQGVVEETFLAAAEKLKIGTAGVALKLVRDFRLLIKFAGFDSASEGGDDMLKDLVVHMHEKNVRIAEILGAVQHFLRTTHANHQYQAAWELELRKLLASKKRNALEIKDLWRGDGDPSYPDNDDPNAWLNITRHERNTSVQFGPEGGFPQSIWVMSYSNFERLYYNLVADYKVWGSTTHKMATWRHMSYVRLEGEDLAISMLPIADREEIRGWFTRGLGAIKNKLYFPLYSNNQMSYNLPPETLWQRVFPKKVVFPARPDGLSKFLVATVGGKSKYDSKAARTVRNVVFDLKDRYGNVSKKAGQLLNSDMASDEQKDWEKGLLALENRSEAEQQESFAQYIPNVTYLRVEAPDKKYWIYSLVADREYLSHNLVLLEKPNRDPQFDTVAVYRGFVGAYPEVFLDIPEAKRNGLAKEIEGLRSAEDWSALVNRYAVKRNLDRFWSFFDWVHEVKGVNWAGNDPVEQGVVDLTLHHFNE